MTGMLVERDPVVVAPPVRPRARRLRNLPAHWPLSFTLLGFPLWWAMGLRTVIPMAMTFVMIDQLLRKRRLVLPAGFTLWVLFLAWLLLGVFVLFADAPGAAPVGGPSTLLVFSYRVAWYLTATVALVWITNLRESELPTTWLYQLLGYMFVVTTVGGLVGVLVPHLEFTSPLEMVLPRGLRSNGLVEAIAHPAVADIQNVLGRPEARPKAPFPFANSWGSNFSMYLPFFLVAWFRYGPRWQRYAAPVVLVLAAIPVVYSLNRGLWASLALGVVGLVLLQIRKGRVAPVAITAGLLVVVTIGFFLSPLGTVFQERLDNQHSNERRSELLSRTVSSVVDGSPVVGFGSTRDVEGSFASIAGGATPDCDACGVPPMGTQGHLWGVMFSQGLVGAGFFLAFFALALARCWRCRTTTETLCTFVLAFLALQLLVYDTLGMPLVTVMLAIGAVAREQFASGVRRSPQLMRPALRRLGAWWPVLLVLTLVGGVAGAAVASRAPVYKATRVSILLEQPPVYLSALEAGQGEAVVRDDDDVVTIDTEAALLVSRQSLARVVGNRDPDELEELRKRIRVTAPPNTSVLTFDVRNRDGGESQVEAKALSRSYLLTRRAFLQDRRDQALELLREQLAELRPGTSRRAAARTLASRDRLEEGVTTIILTPTNAGRVIRTSEPAAVRRQIEIPAATGAAIGLAVGALLMAAFPGWRPSRPRLRRKR
ncbi:MAG: hypothetical protein ABWY19_00195 [Marmoricola sp.]